ncbi:hypothetical protein PsorP6_019347 [Peronosclerospora sorghi]|nr:hypothetical protein PsorP6_019349 [Peronosclerospora sorghi]KAI9895264.1 hypothetical protein PsorP6_019347 [Peronosclerospora sorghi]
MAESGRKKERGKHPQGPTGATINQQDPVFIAAFLYAVSKRAKGPMPDIFGGRNHGSKKAAGSIQRARIHEAHQSATTRGATRGRACETTDTESRREDDPDKDTEPGPRKATQGAGSLSRGKSPRCPGAAATPAEYADWMENALAFMRTKKETPTLSEDTRVSIFSDDTL